jgi:uncharacterized phage-associated protein
MTKPAPPVSAHDVAAYILGKITPLTAMKLQKLLYYSQAWSLVWDEAPLFKENIEAWANGPVVREVYDVHRGEFKVSAWPPGDAGKLSTAQRESVDAVLKFYGDKGGQYLSELTHAEDPWKLARLGVPDGSRGNVVISHASMAEYYGGLVG